MSKACPFFWCPVTTESYPCSLTTGVTLLFPPPAKAPATPSSTYPSRQQSNKQEEAQNRSRRGGSFIVSPVYLFGPGGGGASSRRRLLPLRLGGRGGAGPPSGRVGDGRRRLPPSAAGSSASSFRPPSLPCPASFSRRRRRSTLKSGRAEVECDASAAREAKKTERACALGRYLRPSPTDLNSRWSNSCFPSANSRAGLPEASRDWLESFLPPREAAGAPSCSLLFGDVTKR